MTTRTPFIVNWHLYTVGWGNTQVLGTQVGVTPQQDPECLEQGALKAKATSWHLDWQLWDGSLTQASSLTEVERG